jgi:hypothetical protein
VKRGVRGGIIKLLDRGEIVDIHLSAIEVLEEKGVKSKSRRIERLAKWAKGEKAPPVTIELVPTDRCNLDCLSCWRRGWTEEQLKKRFEQEMNDER